MPQNFATDIPEMLILADMSSGASTLLVIAMFVIILFLMIRLYVNSQDKGQAAIRIQQLEERIAELIKSNSEIIGCLQANTNLSMEQANNMTNNINERLDKVTVQLHKTMTMNNNHTSDKLGKLYESLARIDKAQDNITKLSSEFISLQDILSNKQQRGAFGQGRMESIIMDALPQNAFSFQATLSNNNRPDCLITLPNTEKKLVIDAKFPLEAFQAFKKAKDEISLKQAKTRLQQDMTKHIKDMHERYFIPGETQDTAIMFLPSESIYAELYEHFDDVIQKAYRLRIIIVSPSMLMLAIQVMQSIMKDAQMREHAHLIQKEVINLTDDVKRLHKRVEQLQRHFGQANQSINEILISSGKITKHIEKIEMMKMEYPVQNEMIDNKQNSPGCP